MNLGQLPVESTHRANGCSPNEGPLLFSRGGLLISGMKGFQASKSLAEGGGESLVSLGLIDKEGVTTSIRHVEGIQDGGSWRLMLVCHVAVPRNAVCAIVEELAEGLIVRASMDKMDLGESSREHHW